MFNWSVLWPVCTSTRARFRGAKGAKLKECTADPSSSHLAHCTFY